MIVTVMWLLIMAVCGMFLIELRENHRLHKLMDAHLRGVCNLYSKIKPPFGKREV